MHAPHKSIIIHTKQDACSALDAACALDVPVTLQSAPEAIFYAGSLYLLSLFSQAQQAFPAANACFLLDCGEARAEGIGVLQQGHRAIISDAPAAIRQQFQEMGAVLFERPQQSLDLRFARDARAACLHWLEHAKD